MNNQELIISVQTDETHLPREISWKTTEHPVPQKARSVMMAIWDEKERSTLRVDLWLKDMTVEEMKIFFHQNLVSAAETYRKATGDHERTEELLDFLRDFGKKMGIFK